MGGLKRGAATLAAAVLALVGGAACGNSSGPESTDAGLTGGSEVATSATGGAAAEPMLDACGLTPFALDTEAQGTTMQVVLLDADPAPPVRFYNDWTLRVTDLDGAPVTDADAVVVDPFMPEHSHHAFYPAVVTATETPGEFLASPVYMHMGGLWEVRVRAPDEDSTDAALFHVCIPN